MTITPQWKQEIRREQLRDKTQTKLHAFSLPRFEDFREINKMTTIKEMAKDYTSPSTKNITEIAKVPTDVSIEVKEYTKKEDNSTFKVNEVEILGEVYRVPNSVIKQLKGLLEEMPELEFFKVKSTGSGLSTEYQVFPVEQ